MNSCISFVVLLPLLFYQVVGESDLRALVEFRKGIRHDPSGLVVATWVAPPSSSPACPASFHGVSCDAANVSVTAIVLAGLGLAGELKFSTLSGLKALRNLSLAGNFLSGRLVPAIGSILSLQFVDLSNNQFYGPVPQRITELSGLTELNLSNNNFSGGLPTGFQNLQRLRSLDLSCNGLQGDVPGIVSELRNVEVLDLSSNRLYGSLSVGAGDFSSLGNTLRYMNLSNNEISGDFFLGESMRLFTNLEVLDLSFNRISGQLPQFDGLTRLRILRIGNNQLSGDIPEELFGSALPLEELDLSGNGFTGSLRPFTNLRFLNLSSNGLSGPLPSELGRCVSVDLSKNMLSGDLSALQTWEDTLETLDLSSNALSGSFPNETSLIGSLISIKISNNSLVGYLPSTLGSYPKLSILDLSLNQLTGPILLSLLTSSTLTNLNLSGNQLTGSIPLQSLHSTKSIALPSDIHLETLDLSNNQLSGSLSPEIGNMQRLKLLNLANNTLSAELPSELSKLTGLEVLDLSINHFKGRIPEMNLPELKILNVSYNELSGDVPKSLERFPRTSFYPGNVFLFIPDGGAAGTNNSGFISNAAQHSHMKPSIRVALIVGSVGVVVLLIFVSVAFYRIKSQGFCGMNGFKAHINGVDVRISKFDHHNMLNSQKNDPLPISMNFSNELLLASTSRSMSVEKDMVVETTECGYSDSKECASESVKLDVLEHCSPMTGWKSSVGSPLSFSPHFANSCPSEQHVMLDVCSPDRLVGELFILDSTLVFTAEDLSHAPAEVLGRSSYGTSYKAVLDRGRMFTVKWLRVGFVKQKKEFGKEAKRIGAIRYPNIVSLRGYYWGPREQERLLISDYVDGDSLAIHLHESTPRRYPQLSVDQRLKVAVDVARCLCHLHHDGGLPHGNLKPTNIILTGPDLTARLTDCGLHRLMTPSGITEQLLNLGALGYRAPELATSSKACPTCKADVYSFGVILMEMITRRSAGDIISGQSGAVDLPDWVQTCAREGRGVDCFDKDISGLEGTPRAMEELLAVSLRCILPANERPNIGTVFEDLCSIRL